MLRPWRQCVPALSGFAVTLDEGQRGLRQEAGPGCPGEFRGVVDQRDGALRDRHIQPDGLVRDRQLVEVDVDRRKNLIRRRGDPRIGVRLRRVTLWATDIFVPAAVLSLLPTVTALSLRSDRLGRRLCRSSEEIDPDRRPPHFAPSNRRSRPRLLRNFHHGLPVLGLGPLRGQLSSIQVLTHLSIDTIHLGSDQVVSPSWLAKAI